MSRLGEFLEVVFGATDQFHTLQASIRRWRNCRVLEDARRTEKPARGRRKAVGENSEPIEQTAVSVWMTLPDKIRVEESRRRGENVTTSLEIVNANRSWELDGEGHVEVDTKERRHAGSLPVVDRHFNRALLRQFFVSLDLEPLGDTRTAQQDCIRIRAVPRPEGHLWPHWLPYHAQEYEFHGDPKRGLILSIVARHGGQISEVIEVTEITFDQPIKDEMFRYEPVGGEQVREKDPIVERLTLESAISRMSFKVLVPTRLPDPAHSQLEVMYHPSRMRSPRAYLSFMYRGSDAYEHLWINQGQTPDPDLAEFEWEPITRGGQELRISDPGAEGTRIVTFEQAGTHVSIVSDLDHEALLDLASSFCPASSP
jgi:hypothetical protein